MLSRPGRCHEQRPWPWVQLGFSHAVHVSVGNCRIRCPQRTFAQPNPRPAPFLTLAHKAAAPHARILYMSAHTHARTPCTHARKAHTRFATIAGGRRSQLPCAMMWKPRLPSCQMFGSSASWPVGPRQVAPMDITTHQTTPNRWWAGITCCVATVAIIDWQDCTAAAHHK